MKYNKIPDSFVTIFGIVLMSGILIHMFIMSHPNSISDKQTLHVQKIVDEYPELDLDVELYIEDEVIDKREYHLLLQKYVELKRKDLVDKE